jgi:hypothetical protein
MDQKPYKGTIVGVRYDAMEFKNLYGPSLGYIVRGRWVGHPDFGNSVGHTSLIVHKGRWSKKDEHGMRNCEVETLNSRYTWREAA